jgi:uncharacterized membrane protein YbaN (DUF454 family)
MLQPAVKRILILVAGWLFILLGIVGLFLPILQGIVFLLIGLVILSSEYIWAHHLLSKLRQRFPSIAAKADEAKRKADSWIDRLSGHRRND